MGESSLTALIAVRCSPPSRCTSGLRSRPRRVPTVTDIVKSAGWPARILVGVGGALALFDHFVTGWVL